MKKLLSLVFILTAVFLTGCSSFKVVSNTVSDDFIKSLSHKDFRKLNCSFRAYFLDEDGLERFIKIYKEAIFNDNKLTDAQKVNLIAKIKPIKFEDNKFLYYYLANSIEPLLGENKPTIKLENSKKESIYEEIFPVSMVTKDQQDNTFYTLVWVVIAKTPVTKENYKDSLPILMTVEFPNGMKTVYTVLE